MTLARQLFNDFCYYRQHTAHIQKIKQARPYLRNLKETAPRLALFTQLSTWCVARQIDPREWLYSLFVSRRWLYAPKLELGHLLSEKHLPKYKSLSEYSLYRKRQEEQSSLNIRNRFDPNKDISHNAEDAKRYYLSQHDTNECMARMQDETFGFHPGSAFCAHCPVMTECLKKLEASVSFDIIALRKGLLSPEDAQAQALAQVQHYGRY